MKKHLLSGLLMGLLTVPAMWGADYGLPEGIQEGNILHCFNWPINTVKAELKNIAEAGFGSVQLSPLQRPDVKVGYAWHDLYRPYDLAFKASQGMGSEQDLKALCDEAAKYGIKIIVDVVANHVDKTRGYHDSWWDANGRVRWNGNINYGDRYSITHGQLGDYGDLNSEDYEVAQRGKAYVEKLKSLGVKGVRWDAAKHIGLPSEGCGFWSTVTSVPGMYHYGEILDAPGPNGGIIKEYTNYMSVTDNKYCNYAARDNGGVPGGYAGSHVVDYGAADSKMVYWGESHDTYSNDEWSQNVDQSVIDRAYAAYACRNGATALYLSRPNAKGFNNIKIGKGSEAYRNKAVAEVNKFRNAMVGRADYFEGNGNACSITREDGGAVIVMKGSGYVTVANGGGFCPAGNYVDRVSGSTFTVTSTTISGNVGGSGIAVIYNDGVTPPIGGGDDDDDDDVVGEGNYIYFDNSNGYSDVRVWAWTETQNCTLSGTWPGDAMVEKNGVLYWQAPDGKMPENIIISWGNHGDNERAGKGDLKFVGGYTYYADGSFKNVEYEEGDDDDDDDNGDDDDNAVNCLYFSNNYHYSNVTVWAWNDSENCTVSRTWPGDAMMEKNGLLYWEAPEGKAPTQVIISWGNHGDYDRAGKRDLKFVSGHTYYADGSHLNIDYNEGNDDGKVRIFLDGNWSNVHAYIYSETTKEENGAWPGKPMTLNAAGIWEYEVPESLYVAKVMFNTGLNGYNRYPADQQPGLDLNGTSMIFHVSDLAWEKYSTVNRVTGNENSESGINGITVDESAESANPIYFNLQGVRVENPTNGLYIVVRGNHVSKVNL